MKKRTVTSLVSMYLEVRIVPLSRPPPADLPVIHGSESELHGPSKRSKKISCSGCPREKVRRAQERRPGNYEGAFILYFLTLDLVGVSGARGLSLA